MASQRRGSWRVYRIADRRHTLFDGQGAAIFGGRWNSPGRRVIYAAESYAGAMLEVLANANIGRMPKRHAWIEILIAGNVSVEQVDVSRVRRWDAPDQHTSRIFGDKWYDQQRSAVLIVPSTVTRVERNVVINEAHPEFVKLRATRPKPVIWDQRLFDR
jgi:RES domain-containing protein